MSLFSSRPRAPFASAAVSTAKVASLADRLGTSLLSYSAKKWKGVKAPLGAASRKVAGMKAGRPVLERSTTAPLSVDESEDVLDDEEEIDFSVDREEGLEDPFASGDDSLLAEGLCSGEDISDEVSEGSIAESDDSSVGSNENSMGGLSTDSFLSFLRALSPLREEALEEIPDAIEIGDVPVKAEGSDKEGVPTVVPRTLWPRSEDDREDDEELEALPDLDIELEDEIDLGELGDVPDDGEAARGGEVADSVLAWGALGMILGSPAPRTSSRKSAKLSISPFEDDGRADAIPDIDEEADDGLGLLSTGGIPEVAEDRQGGAVPEQDELDLSELMDADLESGLEERCEQHGSDKEGVDSVLVWSALAALMGSPAPQNKSKRRNAKHLFEEGREATVDELQWLLPPADDDSTAESDYDI